MNPHTKKNSLSSFLKKIAAQKSGRRFRFAYRAMKNTIQRHWLIKVVLVLFSLFVILCGLLLLVLPGPGLLVLIFGVALFSLLSYGLAKNLDRIEKTLYQFYLKRIKRR